jgi:hypothetical protein
VRQQELRVVQVRACWRPWLEARQLAVAREKDWMGRAARAYRLPLLEEERPVAEPARALERGWE